MAGNIKFIWLFRFMRKSFGQRKSRLFLTLFALIIAGSVLSVFITLHYDINIKMKKELRAYGANLILFPRDKDRNSYMDERKLDEILQVFGSANLIGCAPYLFTVVESGSNRVVLSGGRFSQMKKVSPYWIVQGEWVTDGGDGNGALAGYEAARKLKLKIGQTVRVTDAGTARSVDLEIKGIVKTGGQEEYQIFTDLPIVQDLAGKEKAVNIAYASAMGDPGDLERLASDINGKESGISASLIRRISQSEGLIIEKIRALLLLVTIVTLFSTLLSVGATMTAMTLGRRKEIGLKKALGASNRDILAEFIIESVILGICGGALGFVVGFVLVQFIGRSVFSSAVSFRAIALPASIAFSAAISVLASLLPIRTALRMESAVVLKGE